MKTVLIIGSADTSYGINTITEYDSVKIVEGLYGSDSQLTNAFKMFRGLDNVKIFLSNTPYKNDYVEVVNTARHSNLDFIVPLGVCFSDKTIDILTGKQHDYAELLLKSISETSETILIMTDNHAKLYEDIDHYLKDMTTKIKLFKKKSQLLKKHGRQLWFVANNIKNVSNANAMLCAAVCANQTGDYPLYDFPDAIFDIDSFDIKKNELIYFKNNTYAWTSIENFKNFCTENIPEKIVPIDLVVRQINKELDLTKFCGMLMSNVTKLKIRTEVVNYLNSIKSKLIRDYEFIDIIINLKADYTYSVTAYFYVLPINSLEKSMVVITT